MLPAAFAIAVLALAIVQQSRREQERLDAQGRAIQLLEDDLAERERHAATQSRAQEERALALDAREKELDDLAVYLAKTSEEIDDDRATGWAQDLAEQMRQRDDRRLLT